MGLNPRGPEPTRLQTGPELLPGQTVNPSPGSAVTGKWEKQRSWGHPRTRPIPSQIFKSGSPSQFLRKLFVSRWSKTNKTCAGEK